MSGAHKKRSSTSQSGVSNRKGAPAIKPTHKRARFDSDAATRPSKSSPKSSTHDSIATSVVQKKRKVDKVTLSGSLPERSVATPGVKGKGKAAQVPASTSPASKTPLLPKVPTTFKLVAGSYEKLLYGLEGSFSTEEGSNNAASSLVLKPIFIFPAHVSCVNSVAASPSGGKWLASGSTDEVVKVWDLRRRKEVGGLIQHVGSITHLNFPSRTHLLSASEDGTLCLFHTRDWSVLRVLKGHKGRVNCVAVHPSGKVALSVGKDRTLRMWDFMRGKGSASTKLGKEGELVRWSTTGATLAVQALSTIDIYSTDTIILHTIQHTSRVQDIKFCSRSGGAGQVLLVAAEDKKVSVHELEEGALQFQVIAELVGHSNRVKAVDTLVVAIPTSDPERSAATLLASTASSDGKIHVYDLSALPAVGEAGESPKQLEPLAAYDSKGSRLTCLTMADGEMLALPTTAGKRKQLEGEEAEVEEPEEGSDDGESGEGSGAEEEESGSNDEGSESESGDA